MRWQTLMLDLQVHGSELARQHGHWFELLPATLPVDAGLLMDERRLRQVLDNLLVNASLYGAGSPVTLTCAAQVLPDERMRLRFEVADSGPGIAPAEQVKVFVPFVRGQAQRQGGGGVWAWGWPLPASCPR